ncbi:MAG: hypothetical protein HY360_06320 [Verrucomicrobia bacterium]|nr:hypothetical protein [Verrucomicrobiota bacterium]
MPVLSADQTTLVDDKGTLRDSDMRKPIVRRVADGPMDYGMDACRRYDYSN